MYRRGYACGVLSRKPRIQNHLVGFASKAGEMSGLVDECTGPQVSAWLKAQGHDVFSILDDARGLDDEAIIRKAETEDRIIITK